MTGPAVTGPAFDTSVAVPYLVRSHSAHQAVRRWAANRAAVLTAHSLAETYSVLTRLPGDARLTAVDAVRLIDANFADSRRLIRQRAGRRIGRCATPSQS